MIKNWSRLLLRPLRSFSSRSSAYLKEEEIDAPKYVRDVAASVFHKLDRDGNNALERDEVIAALRENSFDPGIIDKVMEAVDDNHDGKITFVNFFQGMRFLWGSDKRVHSLVEMQRASCEMHSARPLFGKKVGDAFQYGTYSEFATKVDNCRAGLHKLGVGRGVSVAIVSGNREEWAVAAYGTYSLGGVFVPMYEQQQPSDWKHIINDSGAKVLVVSTGKVLTKIAAMASAGDLKNVSHIVHMESADVKAGHIELISFETVLKNGASAPVPFAEMTENDLANIIYTSGTTGVPKGVELTHGNLLANILSLEPIFPLFDHDRSLCFLPWAHCFGQTTELHALVRAGGSIAIASDVSKLVADMALVKPTIIFSVPQVFTKIQAGILSVVEKSNLKKNLFNLALSASQEKRRLPGSLWVDLKFKLLDKIVLETVREKFGGNLRAAICGGAKLEPSAAKFMDNLGIPVFEGYGLTETSPIISCNSPGAHRYGSVGQALPGVSVFVCDAEKNVLGLGEEGELHCVGPNIMVGYHNNKIETEKVIFNINGRRAFATGDLGVVTADGYVYVTGRAKEQFKIANGKYVAPSPIEEAVKLSPYIHQAFVHGDGVGVLMLVVPASESLKIWAETNKHDYPLNTDVLRKFLEAEIAKNTASLPHYTQPKLWDIVSEEFTVENGLATPKLSLKRKQIADKYRAQLNKLSMLHPKP